MISKPSKIRRRKQKTVLHARVVSPRIVWFGLVRLLASTTKLACVLVAILGVVWGVQQWIRQSYHENPEFRLQVIDLNPNHAVTVAELVQATGLDLSASLFDIDVETIEMTLNGLPQLSAASVERNLPGTLKIRVEPRRPEVWLVDPRQGMVAERKVGGLLVSDEGIVFPCSKKMLHEALALPMVVLSQDEDLPIIAGKSADHRELRNCLRLLNAAVQLDPDSAQSIESITQVNSWSLELLTREGVLATFSLGDHERQIINLRAALERAAVTGRRIATINLLPRENLPVTFQNELVVPRAIEVAEPSEYELTHDRREADLNSLLQRN